MKIIFHKSNTFFIFAQILYQIRSKTKYRCVKCEKQNFLFYSIKSSSFFSTKIEDSFGFHTLIVRSSFVIRSFARAARTVICSSFVRHLFVICSSFVRLLFVFCSSFVRLLFVFCLSFHYLPVVLRLPVRLAPACVAHTARRATTSHFLPFIFYLLPK